MTDKTEKLSVELNDAFTRLEQAQDTKSPDQEPRAGKSQKKPRQGSNSGSVGWLSVLTVTGVALFRI